MWAIILTFNEICEIIQQKLFSEVIIATVIFLNYIFYYP